MFRPRRTGPPARRSRSRSLAPNLAAPTSRSCGVPQECEAKSRSSLMPPPLRCFLLGLALDAQRGDRPRLQSLDADGTAALLADAVRAVLDTPERLVDLGDELALAIADAQRQVAIALQGRAIRGVREGFAGVLRHAHSVHGSDGLGHQLLAAFVQELLEGVEIA